MKEQLESIREAARQELAKIESRAGLDAARVRIEADGETHGGGAPGHWSTGQ